MPSSPARRAPALVTLAVVMALAGLVPTATSAAAAPAGTSASGAGAVVPVAASGAVPDRATWLAQVQVVADDASAYLDDRLPDTSVRPAVVLDIDNTSLETYYGAGLVIPAVDPVLAIARQAADDGAAVFFVTARTELIRSLTRSNLVSEGYPLDGLKMRGVLDFSSDATLKTTARTAIEAQGYTIVANIGNNGTDLTGGHAERTFKLPDYDGALS